MSRRYDKTKDLTPLEKQAKAEKAPICREEDPETGWVCTLPKGHGGIDHIACGGNTFIAWDGTEAEIAKLETEIRVKERAQEPPPKVDKNRYPRPPVNAMEREIIAHVNKGLNDLCRARHAGTGFVCTREQGHTGAHIATTTHSICQKPYYDADCVQPKQPTS